MGKVADPEIKQPKKKGRPRKYPEGSSQYFKKKTSSAAALTAPKPGPAPDPAPAILLSKMCKSNDWHYKSQKEKKQHYVLTSKMKSFASHCTAIPVESWEAFRVDHRDHCGLCGKRVEGTELLTSHIREHILLKCLLCTSLFNQLDSFKSHMKNHFSTVFNGQALPCSSAVIKKRIDGESNSYHHEEIAVKRWTTVQYDQEIIGESVEVEEKKDDGSMAKPQHDSMNADEALPEAISHEIGIIANNLVEEALSGAQFCKHTENSVENEGSGGSHCLIPHFSPTVLTSVKPLACPTCNFQVGSMVMLCKHNRQCHKLEDSCVCQGNCSNENVKNGDGHLATVAFEKLSSQSEVCNPIIETSSLNDHALYCRPGRDSQRMDPEIINLDPEVEPVDLNIESIICDDSSDSCVVFIGDPSQKSMPNPIVPLASGFKSEIDIVEIGENEISIASGVTLYSDHVKTPRFPASISEPISLLDSLDDNDCIETVVLDDCEDISVVEATEVCSESKNRKAKKSSGFGKKCKTTITVSEPSPGEPSAKKRKNNPNCKSKSNNSSFLKSERKRASEGRVSKHELKSLFCDIPKEFLVEKMSPSASTSKRVTRNSISSGERSDLSITFPDTAEKPCMERGSEKSNGKNSPNMNFLARLHTKEGSNKPKTANITVDVLGNQAKRHKKKAPNVPRTSVSDEDFKAFSWVVESTSRLPSTRANDKRWRKLLKNAEASKSSLKIVESENKSNHWHDGDDLEFTISDKCLPYNNYLNFEVVDVRSLDESILETRGNESDEAATPHDPLALSCEEALEHDHIFGVTNTANKPLTPSRVSQSPDSKVQFDQAKFISRIPNTPAIQMEDVPELVVGQWLVYHYFYHRFDCLIEKILVFPDKSSFFAAFENKGPYVNISRDKIIDDYVYFCDYRSSNNTTIPIKFGPLDQILLIGSSSKLSRAVNETGVCGNDSTKSTPPRTNTILKSNVSSPQGGSKNLTCGGDDVQKNVERIATPNQEDSMLIDPCVDDKREIIDNCENNATNSENDASSVELQNDTSHEKWMELMNIEMEANEEFEGRNLIKTNDNVSLEGINIVELSLNTGENDGSLHHRKSPVLVNGTMKIVSPGQSDMKVENVSALFLMSSSSDLCEENITKTSTDLGKSDYWGFSDSESDKEDLIKSTPKSPNNETLETENIVESHDNLVFPDDQTTVSKKYSKRQNCWDQLDKVLKKIDEVPENVPDKSVKPFSKKTASLPGCHSAHKDLDFPIDHPVRDYIENTCHFRRQLNAQALHHNVICENELEEREMFFPVMLNENQGNEKKSPIIVKPGPHPSCSSVSNEFDISKGLPSEQLMKNEGRIGNVELDADPHCRSACKSKPKSQVPKSCSSVNQVKISKESFCSRCPDLHRVKVEEYPIHNSNAQRSCDQQTTNIKRLYDNLHKFLNRVGCPKEDCDRVDIPDHNISCRSRTPSFSSDSLSPDYMDDIILQARYPRGGTPCVARDPRDFSDCMSPPRLHQPPSSLPLEFSDDSGSPTASPPSTPSSTRRTRHKFEYRYDSSPSLSPAPLSPTFADDSDSD